jgi:hypothetical protein
LPPSENKARERGTTTKYALGLGAAKGTQPFCPGKSPVPPLPAPSLSVRLLSCEQASLVGDNDGLRVSKSEQRDGRRVREAGHPNEPSEVRLPQPRHPWVFPSAAFDLRPLLTVPGSWPFATHRVTVDNDSDMTATLVKARSSLCVLASLRVPAGGEFFSLSLFQTDL